MEENTQFHQSNEYELPQGRRKLILTSTQDYAHILGLEYSLILTAHPHKALQRAQ